MAKSEVFIAKEIELQKKMLRLHIFDKDIKEQFVKSSGPGGQNVNKVSSCVVLRHVPSGIIVKCQTERSQRANRHMARFLLVNKIEKQLKDEELKIHQEKAKKKRQNRKRPMTLKEHILEEKHLKSEKKLSRQKIHLQDLEEE